MNPARNIYTSARWRPAARYQHVKIDSKVTVLWQTIKEYMIKSVNEDLTMISGETSAAGLRKIFCKFASFINHFNFHLKKPFSGDLVAESVGSEEKPQKKFPTTAGQLKYGQSLKTFVLQFLPIPLTAPEKHRSVFK